MSLPASLAAIELTGTFVDYDGDPRTGQGTITLSAPIRSEGDNVIVPVFSIDVELDQDGSFAIALPATTDPDWLPNSAYYLVQFTFDDYRKLWWSFPLPYDTAGATLDMADVGAPNIGTPSATVVQGVSSPIADGGYRSTWSSGRQYRAGDLVVYTGTLYGALRASLGVTPGTQPATWQLVSTGGGGGGAVDSVNGFTGVVVLAATDVGAQPVDADLTTIAGLTPTTANVIQSVAGAWASRTPAQLKATLGLVKADVGLANVDNTSDANKPVSTAQASADTAVGVAAAAYTDSVATTKADLVGGFVPSAQIPAIAITEYLGTVISQAAMLALTGQKGDWAIRSDLGTTWVITGMDPTQLASWTQLSYPTAPVTSVNGQTGTVSLAASDVGAVPTTRTITAGTGLTGGGDLSANRTLTVAYGTSSTTAAVGNDARLSDARTPTAHAASHASGGGDPVTLAQSQVTSLTSDLAAKQPLATLTTKGDLYVATASATVARQGVGADGFVLTADAAQTNGVKWAAPSGGGGGLTSSTLLTFRPTQNEQPASNPATFDTRNGHPVLDFDASTDEVAIFTGILPRWYAGGGLTVYVHAALTSAITGTLGWKVAIEADSAQDLDADGFASDQTITAATVPGTSGVVLVSNVAITSGANMDSLAAGGLFRIRITRDTANDTATGDAELVMVEVKES